MVQEVHMLWTDLTTFGVEQTARQEPYKRNSMTTTNRRQIMHHSLEQIPLQKEYLQTSKLGRQYPLKL
jgi:hypothetical protein